MRKIFTFLFAALMSVGMWAEPITVTWNNDDISGSGNSFTKDGVTLTCGMNIDWDNKKFLDGGTFTTDLGNFTEIKISADALSIGGEGWSGRTWTGNAASVSYSGEIEGKVYGVTFVFTIEPAGEPGESQEPQPDPTVMFIAFPTENRPENIELAGVNRDFSWAMVALDNDPWYVSKENLNTYATDTIKFRDKANNAMILCEFIPANGAQEGRWQQLYLVMGDYPMDSYKLDIVRYIDELDLSNASSYAWMENAPEPLPEGIEHIVLTEKAKKVIVDGMVYIVRDGKLFNLTGAQVR